MSSAQRAPIEHLSEREVVKFALEFTTHGAMLLWYAEGFVDRRGLKEIQKELAAKKKAVEDAKVGLEALSLEHSECFIDQAGLTKKLEGACMEVATLTQQLKDLGLKYNKEEKETGQLTQVLQQVGEKVKQ